MPLNNHATHTARHHPFHTIPPTPHDTALTTPPRPCRTIPLSPHGTTRTAQYRPHHTIPPTLHHTTRTARHRSRHTPPPVPHGTVNTTPPRPCRTIPPTPHDATRTARRHSSHRFPCAPPHKQFPPPARFTGMPRSRTRTATTACPHPLFTSSASFATSRTIPAALATPGGFPSRYFPVEIDEIGICAYTIA